MTSAKYVPSNFNVQDGTTYKTSLDADNLVLTRTGAAFQCYANETPAMNIKVAAGGILLGTTLTEQGVQTSGTITAPVSNPRIDRVVIDALTAVASVITGSEAVSPTPPAITAGKIPVAQIALATSTTTITNSLITDERVTPSYGAVQPTLTLTDAATINWNATSAIAEVTLGGARTMAAPTNLIDGRTYLLHVLQDATGSRTITWNAIFKWPAGIAPVLSTGANKRDILSFVCRSGNLHGTIQKDFL